MGILTSHNHGDHIGDLPYILGGVRGAPKKQFHAHRNPLDRQRTAGRHSRGHERRERGKTPAMASRRTIRSTPFRRARRSSIPASTAMVVSTGATIEWAARCASDNTKWCPICGITASSPMAPGTIAGFSPIRSGATGGAVRPRRSSPPATANGASQVRHITGTITCHHAIFAWHGKQATADSARVIRLLSTGRSGRNYFFCQPHRQ